MKVCKHCRIKFVPNHKSRLFCTKKCLKTFHNRAYWPKWKLKFPDKYAMHQKERFHWVDEAIREYGKKCKLCESTENIQVHHIQPRDYQGKDELENLVVLCRKHHILIHKRIKNSIRPLVIASMNFKELFSELRSNL